MENEILLSTYTSWSLFRNCQRAYFWRYVRMLRQREKENTLVFGSLIHVALKLWHESRNYLAVLNWIIANTGLETDQGRKNRNQAIGMMRAYMNRYSQEPFEVVDLERKFKGPILNPETGAASRTFVLAGRYDGLVTIDDGLWLLEHKTTSDSGPGYIEKLWTDFQVALYKKYIERERGVQLEGVLYNILTKPALRQYEAGKTRKVAETDEEFQERLLQKCLEPGMLHREKLIIPEYRTQEIEIELWRLTQIYLEARRSGVWSQNTSFCFHWNRPCAFFPLCRSGGNEMVQENLYEKVPPFEELQDEPQPEFVY